MKTYSLLKPLTFIQQTFKEVLIVNQDSKTTFKEFTEFKSLIHYFILEMLESWAEI